MNDDKKQRSFQFRLLELFVAVTTFAVMFGMIGWWGFDGLIERMGIAMFIAGGCVTAMEWNQALKENLGQ